MWKGTYFVMILDCRQESLMRYLEMQRLQNHFCWWSFRIRYQCCHHCQSHHEQIEKAQRRSSSSKIIITTKSPKERKKEQTMISVYLNTISFITFFIINLLMLEESECLKYKYFKYIKDLLLED